MAFYWLFLTIIFPGIAHAKNATIESRNIEDMFHQAFKFGGEGSMWATKNGYLHTCSNNGDYVFLTEKINITDTFTDAIYVTMKTSFTDTFNNNKSLKIYLHTGSLPPSTVSAYDFRKYFFQNFSLIYSVENNTASMRRGDDWTHIFKFHKNESKIVTLGVRGIGVCARVYSIKVYYYFCEEINQRGVRFPKTISPFEGQKKVEVNCSVNSSPSSYVTTLTGFCTYSGTWGIEREIGCFCQKGFEQNSSNQCMPCRDNYFKPLSSNETCQLCPAKRTNTDDRTSCKCTEGYYHFKGEPTTTPCFGPIEENFDISVKKLNQKVVNISWQAILVDEEMSNSLHYDVECFLCENQDSLSCNKTCKNVEYKPRKDNLTQTFVRISELEPGNHYVFRVYPKTVINIKFISKDHWNYSETRYLLPITISTSNIPSTVKVTGKRSTGFTMTYFDYVVISGIASGVLFMIMVVLLVIVLKRKSDYRRHLIIGNQHQVELPELGQKLYIDPTNYDSPQDALNEFTSEVDPSVLVLEKLIGGGEFGDVYKGYMKTIDGKSLTVAVKTLRNDHSAKNEKDFLLEASVMGQFHDPNVIRLEGVVTRSTPRMIVTEFMSNGSLDRFLRVNDENLTNVQLIGMARGVASGMAYLSAMNFIHRDLAARNILVNDDLLCKITDFGLSRSVETNGSDGEYNTSGGKIPVRWTAPEAIAYRKFSSASDVWSYGILLWEIMSFGDRPYWEWDNYKVLKEVEEGFRLPAPQDCPKAVHNLMLYCWKANRNERPKFEQIAEVTSGWIRSPETMNDSNHESVIGDWLHSIKMGDYAHLFITAGYESPYQLAGIREEDLLRLGVKLIGHRNKILKAIKAFDEVKTDDKAKLARDGSILV